MPTNPPPPKRDDPLERFVDGVAECWDHATSAMQRTVAGTYDSHEARRDLAKCSAKAAEIGLAVFTGWLDLLQPPPKNVKPNPPTVSTTVPLHESFKGKPLQLYPDGFRGIGWAEQFWIAHDDVHVRRAVLYPGGPEVLAVTVDFHQVSDAERARTIIYEGVIKARGVQAPVTDTIRVAKPAH